MVWSKYMLDMGQQELENILRSKVQKLVKRVPNVHLAVTWLTNTSYHIKSDGETITFTINGHTVWGNFEYTLLALENWPAIERRFLRAQRRFERRITKVVEKIVDTPCQEKS